MEKETFFAWMYEFMDSDKYAKKTSEITQKIFRTLSQKLSLVEAKANNLSQQVDKLTHIVKTQQDEINKLKDSCATQEKQTIRNSIKIDGLEENDGEKPTKTVVQEFFKDKLKLVLNKEDIVSAERRGVRRTDDNKPRKIVVKFASVWTKRDVCRQRRSLKGGNVYINECLTKEADRILFMARKLVKERHLWSAYSYEGDVYVKKTEGQRRGTKVKSEQELEYYRNDSVNSQSSSDSIMSGQEDERIRTYNRRDLSSAASGSQVELLNSGFSGHN